MQKEQNKPAEKIRSAAIWAALRSCCAVMHQLKRTAPDNTKNDKNSPADKFITHKEGQRSEMKSDNPFLLLSIARIG